ncbi:hypothetical protein ABIC99_000608 [Sphaerotilus sulfidivorans]|uniref:DEAD/DEAH box helicase n=1 Tax=Sphaerotilus sulfidivorans TaxID=639200 RepID=A0A5C1Q4A6_9BURK|nr:DEAD/DEAH box helicase [Sphaerotilus sulfidivorans]NZD45208.1 DEAD/DEAH box helicase [Sphaerotilus sulfidivorans]QEN02307.1 DEAD/DEAH box helicase [Sphaerotilus sulfidivorans]
MTASEPVAVAAEPTAAVPAKPARKRAAPRRKAAASEPAVIEPVEAPVAEPIAEPVAEAEPPAPEPAPTPAKPARKRAAPRARKTAAQAEVTPAVAAEPAVAPAPEPVPEPVAAPVEETSVEAVAAAAPEPAAKTPRKRAPRRRAAPEAAVEGAAEPTAEPVVEPVVEAAAEPVTEPAAEPAVAPVAEADALPPAVDNSCGQAVDNIDDPMPQPDPEKEPEPETEPEPEPQPLAPPFSQVVLEAQGPVRRLAWTPGRDCPAELLALAAQLDQPTAAAPLVNDLALLEMVRIARERRHALRVDEAVWLWLAPARDMRERVHLLETRMPEGPASPLLTALVTLPLRTYQGEGALYAACAGRSVLADDAGLGRTVQAVAALRLLAAQFGAERALVLAPAERLAHWAEQWQTLTGLTALQAGSVAEIGAAAQAEASPQAPLLLLADAALAVQDDTLAALQAFAPDSVVVDESDDANLSPWLDTAFAAALATLDGPFALAIARTPVEVRPRALRAMLEWIDAPRLGAIGRLEALAEAPVAERLEALGPWLLRRTKTLVLRQLPETVEAICPVELDAAERPLHDARLAQIVRAVQRWQRSRYLSDADQRRLLSTLHALRLGCNAGKIGTTIEGIETLLAEPDMRVVVFSQWTDSLEALSAALSERGIAHLALPVDAAGEARRALVSAFQQDPQQRVLLCCDDSPGGQLGLRHAATAILHLDRPWNPALLAQRFSRVHRADRVRQVPVCHLVASHTLEERLVQAQDDAASREHFVGLIDGAQAEAFLGGARLERFMAALAVLAGLPA